MWMLLFFTGCDATPISESVTSEQKLAVRIITDYRADSIGYQQLQEFARLLQEKSANTIVVQLYERGEWSEPENFLEYVDLQSVEMACLPMKQASLLQPTYMLFEQPYLFSSLHEVENYIKGETGRDALNTLPENYYGIGFVPDGYLYLVNQEGMQWVSYGDLKQMGQTKALEEALVYDLQAIYQLHPLVTSHSWWDGLTEEQQAWIQESFQEALVAIFIQQNDQEPAQMLLSVGVEFQNSSVPEWSTYSGMYLNQREQYFAEHNDQLTVYW